MATIVRSTKTDERYVLLGAGFGAYQSKKPNWLLGDLAADTDEGCHAMVCVCNADGRIGWLDSEELVVESIDGKPVAVHL